MKKKWFSKVLTSILFLLVLIMVIAKYFYLFPVSDIDSGFIVILLVLVLIGLSESFDNFSIGKIFSMSKTIKEKESDIEKLTIENKELINQIISITSINNQSQSTTSIFGFPDQLLSKLSVSEAEDSEIEKKEQEEQNEDSVSKNIKTKRINHKELEDYIFQHMIKGSDFYTDRTFRNMKIQAFQGIDPISDNAPVFDVYVNDINKDVFYEIIPANIFLGSFLNRLYNMLSKIYYYRKYNKRLAYLHLYIITLPNDKNSSSPERNIERIRNYFIPAIKGGLLHINEVELSDSEYQEILNKQ